MRLAEYGNRRLRSAGRQDRGGRAAVCVGVGATAVRAAGASGVVGAFEVVVIGGRKVRCNIVMRMSGLGMVHLRVREIMRMGELGRM
jgi:hypothetical protein